MNNDIAVSRAAESESLEHYLTTFYPSSPLQAKEGHLNYSFFPHESLPPNTIEGYHPSFEQDLWSSTLDPQVDYSYPENSYPTDLLDLNPFDIPYSPGSVAVNSAHQEEDFSESIVTDAQATFTIWEDKDLLTPHPAKSNFASKPATADIAPPRVVKRTLGRPRGSLNKPKDFVKVPKKKGRPLGALDSRPRKQYTWKTPRKNGASWANLPLISEGNLSLNSETQSPTTRYLGSPPPRGIQAVTVPSQVSPVRINSPTMPYNNAAIAPPEEITGGCSLPLARVKKILHIDEDTHQVSNNASYVITVATEMFIRYLAEQALNVVKAEKKPRRNIQYKDLANAVARIDNLQFLEDVIPQTTTYREYKARRANKAIKAPQPLQNGQTTLDGSHALPQQEMDEDQAEASGVALDPEGTADDEIAGAQRPQSSRSNGNGLVFEHYEPNGISKRDESGDFEMS